MKRTPTKKSGRSIRAGARKEPDAAPVARKGKPGAGKAAAALPSALLAEMEHHRDLLQLQNEELGKAHAALEISHQRFSELHEQAPVGYLTLDRQGCIRAINLEAVRLLGVARHTVIGKPFLVFVEQEDRQKFLKHLWEMRRARADSQFGTELRLITSDGTLRHVRMITGRHRDLDGRSTLFLCAIADTTELHAASASAAHLASIVESARDAIVTFTKAGLFRSWNPAAEAIFGYSKDEILGKHVSILAPEDRKGEILQTLKLALGGMPISPFETVRQRKDGTLVDVEVSLFPILESGHVIALTAIIRDITERKATAERLRRKAELLSLAQEAARMGVFEWDLVTNKAVWTPELEALMGIKLEDRPDNLEPWFAQIHPEDQPRLQQVFQEWMESDRTDVTEHYRFLSNGDERWFELRGRITRDASGTPLKMIGTNPEITERKKLETAVRELQRLTRATLEAIPAQIALLDESGTIVDINGAWQKFSEENEGSNEALGRGVNYLTVCDKVHGLDCEEARRFAAGIRAVLSGRRRVFTMDYACHSPREQRWFTGYVTPVAGPGPRMAVIAHVNITTVKLAEEKFRGVMESAPDALVITDRVGRIQMVNRQAERLFGYTRKELVGQTVEMLMPQTYRRAHAARHGQYSEAPTNRPMGGGASFPARRKDGSEFPAEIGLSPLQTAEGMLVCSVIRDITDRKKAEDEIRTLNAELEARVTARTAALADSMESLKEAIAERRRLEQEVLEISETERQRVGQDLHDDLGQQLAGLWFFGSALEKNLRAQSSPDAENAARIAGQLDKALSLTRSLARGLQPVMPEPGGLMAALRELAGRSSQLFKVRCRFSCARPVNVHDPTVATHLYRIAQEAVTNAARHAHAKHISILLSSSAKELVLSVNDDGEGIQDASGKHAGMGIRTMNYRAEALGGSLVFHSKRRGGTSVVCTIPPPPRRRTDMKKKKETKPRAKPAPARVPTRAAKPAVKEIAKPAVKQARVFIVDDHPIFREGLAGVIRQQPDLMVCGHADTAARAFEEIPRAKPDILLTDIGLPGKSGLELLKDIHAFQPSLPVLVISMHDELLYAERILHAGGRGYVMKQEGPDKILQAIATVLSGKVHVSEKMSAGILERIVQPGARTKTSPIGKLSDREFEILRLIGEGKDYHQIAADLHLSLKTVQCHKTHIREKLGLETSAAVIHFASRWLAENA